MGPGVNPRALPEYPLKGVGDSLQKGSPQEFSKTQDQWQAQQHQSFSFHLCCPVKIGLASQESFCHTPPSFHTISCHDQRKQDHLARAARF